MKNVLLIGPCNPKIRSGQHISPPLGLHRLASYIRNKGIAHVDVIDPSTGISDLDGLLDSKAYDVVGHSILHPTIENNMRIMGHVAKVQPSALNIAGGVGASYNSDIIFENTATGIVVRGFGESQLEQIILGSRPLEDVPGLYINLGGKAKETPRMDPMHLDEFRRLSLGIDFSKIPYERYWDLMENHYNPNQLKIMKNSGITRTVRIVASNYCPGGCTFCSSTRFLNDSTNKRQVHLHLSPDEVTKMMDNAISYHPATEAFYFNDDNFMMDSRWISGFCRELEKFNSSYNLVCMSRVDDVDSDILGTMHDVGFRIIFYGVETFSDRLAYDIGKTYRNQGYGYYARTAITETLDAGIVPQMSLMLFLPSSRIEDIITTIDASVELISKGARATVLPYVEAYEGIDIARKHRLSYNTFNLEGREIKVPLHVLPDDDAICHLAHNSLALKKRLNSEYLRAYGESIPHPLDALNLFKAVYMFLGRDSSGIEEVKNQILAGR